MEHRWVFGGRSLILRLGDLTTADADAVVNAANSGLMGGGGVDGAIHRAAGRELKAACQEIIHRIGTLPTGDAVITPGFNLKARHVIHTVGPIWRGGGRGEEALLRSAYVRSLALAAEQGLKSVAFPALSCGAYGYPEDRAAAVAFPVLRQELESGDIETVILYLYSEQSFRNWIQQGTAILGDPHE